MANRGEFVPWSREKLLALLSTAPSQELWPGVLGVVFESACEQENWNLATALIRAGAELEALRLDVVAERCPQ